MPEHFFTAIGIVVGCVTAAAAATAARTSRFLPAVVCAASALGAVVCVVVLRVHLPTGTPPWQRLLAPRWALLQ